MGNVCYADFFDKMVEDFSVELSLQMHGAAAEKKGDVIEMWLGFLDLCNQVKGIPDLELTRKPFDADALYPGLEQALRISAASSRSIRSPNTN